MSSNRGRKHKSHQNQQKEQHSFFPQLWDFSSLAQYLSMLQLNPTNRPPPLMLNTFTDVGNLQNYLQMYMPRQNLARPYSSLDRPSYRNENHSPAPPRNDSSYRSRSAMATKPSSRSILPAWATDCNGELRRNISFFRVLESGELMSFAMDKFGCQFVQDALREKLSGNLLEMLFEQVIGRQDVFLKLSTNMYGNFFVQQVIEISSATHDSDYDFRQEKIKEYLAGKMTDLSLDKSACRVVQCALECLDLPVASYLVHRIPQDIRFISICTDKNANHVVQKIVDVIPLHKWEFIIDFMSQPHNLRQICLNKYGCRVVQTIIEKLTHDSRNADLTVSAQHQREVALQRIMSTVIAKCAELATNEYANYIIQHVVSAEELGVYRDKIIETCLMKNLLSLSQEKYASHVVEKAFLHAPVLLFAEMIEEIFDGYVPHPETGKDALDIMLFHQFGNYVVQCMLTVCCESISKQRNTKKGGYDYFRQFEIWLKRLQERILKEKNKLMRFSSGKKMIETLQNLRYYPTSSSASAQYSLNQYYTTASEDEYNEESDEMRRDEKISIYLEKIVDENARKKRKSARTAVALKDHDHDGDIDDESDDNFHHPPPSQSHSSSSKSFFNSSSFSRQRCPSSSSYSK